MRCLICRQAELVETITSVAFERGEIRITINNVPARVCPKCGDAIVAENVAVQLLRAAEELSQTGMIEGTQNFHSL